MSWHKIGEDFLRLDLVPLQPKLIAVFLGGSRIYKATDSRQFGGRVGQNQKIQDWDGIIIVNTKHDIFTLISERRSILKSMLEIEQEECSEESFFILLHLIQ